MAYSGTLVTFGQGTGVVVAIGDDTELGQISQMLATVKPITTRLLQQMADFGQKLTGAIVILAVVSSLFGILVRNKGITEMFLAAVGLAVAAIPEGLPAIVTIALAIGVQRMAKRNAIIRLLPAVETLGSVTVICSDKTGTLTKNEMTVQTVATFEHIFDVSGSGYDPHGGFSLEGKDILASDHAEIMEIAKGAILCNDSTIEKIDEEWVLQGDPTEGALLSMALKANLNFGQVNKSFPRTDIIPFESEHRFMATLHHDHAGHGFIYVKGAPERILEMCNREWRHGQDMALNLQYWHEVISQTAEKGQRMLAIAFRPAENDHRELKFSDVDQNLILLGMFGIIDPPRSDAIQAIKFCRSAGIKVKMITGDHAITAQAISKQIGISDDGGVLVGEEIAKMDDTALDQACKNISIFARVSPEHKLRLVMVLQQAGEIVAMTGDGVNDAPALKRADVGVAMGIKGTDVSKEAAEMVLIDDNFASIVQAIKEGRTVYDNIRKAITFILPTNGGEAGIIVAAILSGRLMPLTPVQILWVNMITAVTLALTLAFEPSEEGIMERTPRDPKESMLSYFLVWRVIFVSLLLVIGTFGLFLWERMHNASIDQARTIAVNTLVMFEIFYLFNTRAIKTPILSSHGFFANKTVFVAVFTVVGAQFLFTYLPFMQTLFDSTPIPVYDWLRITLITVPILFIVEIEKVLLKRWEIKQKKLPIHLNRRFL
jgi:potassium/sodium efflux P-type ATPase